VLFQDTPQTYYDAVNARLPGHGEDLQRMRERRILIDGAPTQGQWLLLQIFTQNVIGPCFFEIIQRKGNEGFGEGNFKALFESLEADQLRRGVLSLEPPAPGAASDAPASLASLVSASRVSSSPASQAAQPSSPPLLAGFGNHFETEALPGALPAQNSPQRCPYGLYAEQLSGTAFTAPRAVNRRSWLYRIHPAARHGRFQPYSHPHLAARFEEEVPTPADRLRWNPLPIPSAPCDFIDGMVTF